MFSLKKIVVIKVIANFKLKITLKVVFKINKIDKLRKLTLNCFKES